MAWWGEGHAEPWFVLTDLAPDACDAQWYALRGWCEQGFKFTAPCAYAPTNGHGQALDTLVAHALHQCVDQHKVRYNPIGRLHWFLLGSEFGFDTKNCALRTNGRQLSNAK